MGWDEGGGRLPTTSELGLSSVLTPSVLVLLRPNQAQSEYKPSPNQDQTELGSHTVENHIMGTGLLRRWPPRFGLGLALGVVVLLLTALGNNGFAQDSGAIYAATRGSRACGIQRSRFEHWWILPDRWITQ